ncbi:MAG: hypothetical protein N2234_01030, partial [Planctomycetota bacterium]|nr:hypothetical protein [Planctomycetota bacterium]
EQSFSPDGKVLATVGNDRTVRLWNPERGELLRKPEGHTGATRSVAFSPHGKLLASTSEDETIRIWDAQTGKLLHTLTGHRGFVYSEWLE